MAAERTPADHGAGMYHGAGFGNPPAVSQHIDPLPARAQTPHAKAIAAAGALAYQASLVAKPPTTFRRH